MPHWMNEIWARPEIQAVVIITAAFLAAFVVRAVMRVTVVALARRTATDLDDRVVGALGPPVFLSVILIGLYSASGRLVPPASAAFVVRGAIQTLAVLIWSIAAFRIGTLLLGHAGTHGRFIQPRTLPIFDILVKFAVFGTAVYFMFLAWNIDVTAWLASAGIIGLAVGFAAKDTLANFFSGIFILADAPYKVGDYIVIEPDTRGRVTAIGIRSTRVLTRDEIEITIPNAVIGNSKIVNEAGGPTPYQRVRIAISVAYGSDLDQVREVLLECWKGAAHVLLDPDPRVRFRRFGGSGLEFELLVWIEEPEVQGRVVDDINSRIYKAFAAAGIEIPYSKLDVYVKEAPPRAD